MRELKIGDVVKITTDLTVLNQYMYKYAGYQATVVDIQRGSTFFGSLAKLDIDKGEWTWGFHDTLHQINIIKPRQTRKERLAKKQIEKMFKDVR